MQPTTPQLQPTSSSDPMAILNNPQVSQAAQNYADANYAAKLSNNQDQTLSGALAGALSGPLANSPDLKNLNTHNQDYINSVQNPTTSVPTNANDTGGGQFSPSQFLDMLNQKQAGYLQSIGSDNFSLSMQTGGLVNLINSAAAVHAKKTQDLLAQAQYAKDLYDTSFAHASKLSDTALQEQQISQNMNQFLTKLAYDPVYQSTVAKQQMQQALQTNPKMDQSQFANTFSTLPGVTPQLIAETWTQLTGKPYSQTVQQAASTGLKPTGGLFSQMMDKFMGNNGSQPVAGASATTTGGGINQRRTAHTPGVSAPTQTTTGGKPPLSSFDQ